MKADNVMRGELLKLSDDHLLKLSLITRELCADAVKDTSDLSVGEEQRDAANALAWVYLAAAEWFLTEIEARQGSTECELPKVIN